MTRLQTLTQLPLPPHSSQKASSTVPYRNPKLRKLDPKPSCRPSSSSRPIYTLLYSTILYDTIRDDVYCTYVRYHTRRDYTRLTILTTLCLLTIPTILTILYAILYSSAWQKQPQGPLGARDVGAEGARKATSASARWARRRKPRSLIASYGSGFRV